jgi:thioesterase domain-containing protein
VDQERLRFGRRWHTIRAASFANQSASALLELPPEFASDVNEFSLHPALLDMATGIGIELVKQTEAVDGVFVPLTYEHLTAVTPLPSKLHTRVRRISPTGQTATIEFDVEMFDGEGTLVAAIDGLTYRQLADTTALSATEKVELSTRSKLVELNERYGIEDGEGIQALAAVLATKGHARIVASPMPLTSLESAATADAVCTAATAVARPELKTSFIAARDEIESALTRIWCDALGVADIGVDDDFFDLGGHSLIALRVFADVKRQFGANLGLAALFETPTVAGLASILRGDTESSFVVPSNQTDVSKPWPCLVPIKPTGARTPLFCVHGAKGNVLAFREMARHLPAEQPFYGLQLQGLNGVDPFHTDIPEMAAHYVAEVRGCQPHGPYQLAGFSGGGLVALEMAAQLRAAGEEVAAVLLFDAPAPDYDRMRKFPWFYLRNIESVLQYGPSYLWEKVRGRLYWWNWGRGRPTGIDFAHFGRVLWGHEASVYDGRTILFRVKTRVYPADLGWARWLTGRFESYEVSGSHEGMWREPHVRRLAASVASVLEPLAGSET